MDFFLDPQKLIPEGWHGIVVPNREKLIFLGAYNLDYLKQYWQREERNLASSIRVVQMQIDTLDRRETDSLKYKLATLNARKKEIDGYIRYLLGAIKKAEKKPYLPEYRPLDWFRLGDEVVCFISDDFDNALEKGITVTGKISSYEYSNHRVTVYADRQVQNDNKSYFGHGLSYGLNRPEIMRKWEFDYLRTHPEYYEFWLWASVDMTKTSPNTLLEAVVG